MKEEITNEIIASSDEENKTTSDGNIAPQQYIIGSSEDLQKSNINTEISYNNYRVWFVRIASLSACCVIVIMGIALCALIIAYTFHLIFLDPNKEIEYALLAVWNTLKTGTTVLSPILIWLYQKEKKR